MKFAVVYIAYQCFASNVRCILIRGRICGSVLEIDFFIGAEDVHESATHWPRLKVELSLFALLKECVCLTYYHFLVFVLHCPQFSSFTDHVDNLISPSASIVTGRLVHNCGTDCFQLYQKLAC